MLFQTIVVGLIALVAALVTTALPYPSSSILESHSDRLYPRATASSPLAGMYQLVGLSGVSAQMLFWGTGSNVYILDKAENNALKVAGHAAWGVEYNVDTNEVRAMDVITNTFCAGGGKLADGTLVTFGGNKAVTSGNAAASSTNNTYQDEDGGFSIRTLTPCTDGTCEWVDQSPMLVRRWYPTIESLPDGSLIIIGGTGYGQWNNVEQYAVNSYEFYPSTGKIVNSPFLEKNMPTNMYPLTFLMPGGRLFMVANYGSMLYDYTTNIETYLPDMPETPRNYPATGAATILPLTPANNYTATVLFCGGSSLTAAEWSVTYASDPLVPEGFTPNTPASSSCVRISPEAVNPQYTDDDSLPENRVMGQFILLPDGTIWLGNGAETGLAGYGTDSWVIGHSYSNNPAYQPLIYDPNAPAGSRFSSDGLSPSNIERLYHSTAILLPDSSILVSGSNPNTDVFLAPFHWPTRYEVERWYPTWWGAARPTPKGWPTSIGYGAVTFTLSFSVANDLGGDSKNLDSLAIRIVRPGFSTHSVGMSQRLVELRTTFSLQSNGTANVYVQGVPTPNIFSPGKALAFAVINGIPSLGIELLVGNGAVGPQTVVR